MAQFNKLFNSNVKTNTWFYWKESFLHCWRNRKEYGSLAGWFFSINRKRKDIKYIFENIEKIKQEVVDATKEVSGVDYCVEVNIVDRLF